MSLLTIAQALLQARNKGLERLDAQLILLHAIGQPAHARAWLLGHDADPLSTKQQADFEAHVQRRLSGEPLAYLTGRKEFFGLDLLVDARVLVPRPETETLVEWALEILPKSGAGTETVEVLDLGTGSGAIALALKAARPDLKVSAIDRSEDALAVARENASRLRLDVQFWQGSWLDAVAYRYRLIIANPPYVASQDPHLLALRHEPLQALTAGASGLDDLRHIIGQAPTRLQAGGCLLLEHGYDQAGPVRTLLRQAGFVDVESRRDLSGIERCSIGHTRRDGSAAVHSRA